MLALLILIVLGSAVGMWYPPSRRQIIAIITQPHGRINALLGRQTLRPLLLRACQLIVESAQPSVDRDYLPRDVRVIVSRTDYDRYGYLSTVMVNDLARLLRSAIERSSRLALVYFPRLRVEPDDEVLAGTVKIETELGTPALPAVAPLAARLRPRSDLRSGPHFPAEHAAPHPAKTAFMDPSGGWLDLVVGGKRQVYLVELDGKELTVGRDSKADIRIDRPEISRRHAVLSATRGRVQIADISSNRSVRVNDRSATEPVELYNADRIQLAPAVRGRWIAGDSDKTALLVEPPQSALSVTSSPEP